MARYPTGRGISKREWRADHEATRSEQVNDAVGKILDALRSNGDIPVLRIEDVQVDGGGPVPAWTPPSAGGTRTEAQPDESA